MLKKHSQFFSSIFILSDCIILLLSWLIGYWYRYYSSVYDSAIPPGINNYLLLSSFSIVIWIIISVFTKLYRPRRMDSVLNEIRDIISQIFIYFLVITVLIHFSYRETFSRTVILTHCIFMFIIIMIFRYIFRKSLEFIRSKGYNIRQVYIVGTGRLAQKICTSLNRHKGLGYIVKGFISETDYRVGKKIYGFDIVGTIDNISDILDNDNVDLVLIALPFDHISRLKIIMNNIENKLVTVKFVPDFSELFTLRGNIEIFDDFLYVNLLDTPFYGWNKIIKRIFDLFLGFLFFVISLPVMGLVALLIKMSSKGPILYKQKRIGLDNEKFYIYKFRSMEQHIEPEGVLTQAKKNDERITKVGSIIRKFSIDELPQLINVIKGEMSLVGPRPHAEEHDHIFKTNFPKYFLRHKIKCGITGWAQVNGWRGEIDSDYKLKKRIKYDLYYIENWSLLFDIKIIWMTLFKGIFSRNAY